ncbi:MAG: class I SAM-dependent methyltransferase [Myxococcales bacterium]|nr:class I SAM-dependent methyltransferase [Myxococcales bacterium]
MGPLISLVYERTLGPTERAGLAAWRAALLSQARGRVLEIGAGTGLNLAHYPPGLETLVVAEPDRFMRRKLERAVKALPPGRAVHVSRAGATTLPFADASFDTVVSTLVLCTVPYPARTLEEVRRVLAPGGVLLFIEHVRAPAGDPWRRRQRCIEPLWKRIAGGCHLTRDTERAISDAGLVPLEVARDPMRKAPRFASYAIRGRAIKPAAAA